MANEFVQRQITGFIAPGEGTNPNQFDPAAYIWQIQDVYPSTVMKLDPGNISAGLVPVPTVGNPVLPLPANYDSAQRLAVFLVTDVTLRVAVASPAHATSVTLVKADDTQSGIFVFNERVTSITLSNRGSVTANVSYSMWAYPADINEPSAWQGGVETIGTVST